MIVYLWCFYLTRRRGTSMTIAMPRPKRLSIPPYYLLTVCGLWPRDRRSAHRCFGGSPPGYSRSWDLYPWLTFHVNEITQEKSRERPAISQTQPKSRLKTIAYNPKSNRLSYYMELLLYKWVNQFTSISCWATSHECTGQTLHQLSPYYTQLSQQLTVRNAWYIVFYSL